MKPLIGVLFILAIAQMWLAGMWWWAIMVVCFMTGVAAGLMAGRRSRHRPDHG